MRAEYSQRMIFHGVVVFMFGLLSGFFLYGGAFPNPQTGVIVHLEGVLNGTFLAVVGLLWHRLDLSKTLEWRTHVLAIACVYTNFAQAVWGAAAGRSRPTPVFPQERLPFPMEKIVLDVVLLSMSVAFIILCLILLYGLRRGMAAQRNAAVARHEVV